MFPLTPSIHSNLCLKCSQNPADNLEECQTFSAFSPDLHSTLWWVTPGHSAAFSVEPGSHSTHMSSHLAPSMVSPSDRKAVTPSLLCVIYFTFPFQFGQTLMFFRLLSGYCCFDRYFFYTLFHSWSKKWKLGPCHSTVGWCCKSIKLSVNQPIKISGKLNNHLKKSTSWTMFESFEPGWLI